MTNELKQYEQFLKEFNSLTDEQLSIELEEAVHQTLSARERRNQKSVIKAGDLKVGCQVAEADGYLFDVIEVVKETAKTITVRLASDFSIIRNHWTVNGGVVKTFRKNTLLYGIA